ncbi:MAG: murein biosynthesis integral membrane protein MurJ [Candidatus Parcubacteria bacterium]|nr:murein biosynthesis integral membrane protein MurJ [Candidatus Parcubacteria bacterium]
MINRILNSQTKTIHFAAVLISVSTLTSQFLGFFRDRLLAGTFGASENLDIYLAAFRIPDFIYGVLIIGGISAVFLPVFSRYFSKDEEDGWRLANNVLNVFFFSLILISAVLIVFAPYLVNLIAPGFTPAQKDLTANLARIMFFSPLILGVSSIFSGILQYFKRFLVYSFAPVFYNIGIIIGILFFVPLFGLYGLAFGVILGALLHLAIQIPAALIVGWRWKPIFDFKESGLREMFNLMAPRTIGQTAYNINLIIITALASLLAGGSISIFTFSNNLAFFPVSLIGVSFALASFPNLSRAWAEGKKEEFTADFSSTLMQIIFLIIPISVLIFVFREQFVWIVLKNGLFSAENAQLVSSALGLFSISLFGVALIPFLARSFFALHDTRTPVKISVASIIMNILFALFFLRELSSQGALTEAISGFFGLQGDIRILALPLAISLSGILQFIFLFYFLQKKIPGINLNKLLDSLVKIISSAVIMGIAAPFIFRIISANVFNSEQSFFTVFVSSAFAALLGILLYFAGTVLFKTHEAKLIKQFIYGRIF